MKTLIYSPTPEAGKPLERIISQCGLRSELAYTAERTLYLAMTDRYAAILLRGHSPEDAAHFYREWKSKGGTGYMVALTQAQSGLQRARLLELGLDECLIEPCSFTELANRIIQREYRSGPDPDSSHTTRSFRIDAMRRSAVCLEKSLRLTRSEFDLLWLLIRRRGIVLSRMQIWEEIRGYEDYPLGNPVDVHMNRLRRKLPPAGGKLIETIYGIGYRMHDDA
ncbi:MAG: response regulator transcription factor [bacterium]